MKTLAVAIAWVVLASGVSIATAAGKDAAEQAICAVCGPREGAGPEPVRATAVLNGKSYAFCALDCKIAFLEKPAEFLVTDQGKPAPGFTLKTTKAKPLSLAALKGRVVLADFWGTFCTPCVEALPFLESLHRKYSARGLSMLGIAVDNSAATVEKKLGKAGVTYPVLMSTPDVWKAYKVNTLPLMVLIGRDGLIIRRYGGEADRKALVADIERALLEPAPGQPAAK